MWYPDRLPDWFTAWFKLYTWHSDRDKKLVYLTFDDGPTPLVTDYVLELLDTYDFKATFFCIGDCVQRHSDIYKRIISRGHGIGNHTMHHLNRWKTKEAIYLDNVAQASEWIESKLFRPPYGKILPGTAKKLIDNSYKIVMWDVISGDFDTKRSATSCLNNLKKNTRNGSIIIFHDSNKAHEKLQGILPEYFEFLKKEGFFSEKIKHTAVIK